MNNLKFTTLKNCRICKSNKLETILDLGDLYLSNFIDKENSQKAFSAPLELVLCKGKCKLIQLRHTVSAQEMFREYWYLSGINNTMANELEHIVRSIENVTKLNKGDYVLDIGANDGTLLRHYNNKEVNTIGFEPALNLTKSNTKGISKIIPEFFSLEEWNKFYPKKTAKVITAIGMFYDLDDPNKFVSNIEKILSDDGIFVIQMMYLPLFIEKNAFDGICHEHLEYYSLFSLEYLLSKFDLQIIGLEIREKINEGSGRFYITKKSFSGQTKISKKFLENLIFYRNKEVTLKLDNTNIYNELLANINAAREKTMSFLVSEKNKGKLIHGYAASTKGNTTLQYYGITTELIEAISDRNPDKWGRLAAGSNIPVISENESRNRKPDYYFVLAWHFIESFISREVEFLERGGKFVVSMPFFKVIDKSNYKTK
jgi:SAM-dependent methyltransferase